MFKNKNFNFALVVFAITLSLLFAFAEYYPADSISEAEIEQLDISDRENLLTTNQ
ncbi:MAG: hypothetical protein HKO90_10405 [Flavobacteriaceae bacterium]|nr:hypothetical protein [Bacteroidia bacterium]NNK88684.1 hypothetical protein [Flavobacteriaceae bacterium]